MSEERGSTQHLDAARQGAQRGPSIQTKRVELDEQGLIPGLDTPHPHAQLDAAGQDLEAGELPMVVWLRGDEPHCAEFSLSAEEVMERLGIRRSRLTQISGRELRVGRIRRGKYISPIYRPEDVDAYENWTRATATHLKSSTVLADAATALGRHGQQLGERLAGAIKSVSHVADGIAVQTAALVTRAVHERSGRLESALSQLTSSVAEGRFALSQLRQRLDQTLARGDKESAALFSLARDSSEMTSLLRSLSLDATRQSERSAAIEMQLDLLLQAAEDAADDRVNIGQWRLEQKRPTKKSSLAVTRRIRKAAVRPSALATAQSAAHPATISRERRRALRATANGKFLCGQRKRNDALQ